MKSETKYLSLLYSFLLILALTTTEASISNFIGKENLTWIVHALLKAFLYCSFTAFPIIIRQLPKDYLFPLNEAKKHLVKPLIFLLISLFFATGLVMDIEVYFTIGSAEYFNTLHNLVGYTVEMKKYFIAVLLVGPIVEELLFRGLILRSLLKRYNRLVAIIFSSILFALLHVKFGDTFYSSIIHSFAFSVLLSWVMILTENIRTVIVFHILWNLFNYVLPVLIGFIPNLENHILVLLIVTVILTVVFAYLGLIRIFRITNSKTNYY
jgi:membrane protease YdiL (CAAX protease family)